jgi:hypothetical protein
MITEQVFMAAYVDFTRTHESGEWCHMIADTDEEMHALAGRIGISRGRLHISSSGIAHYDLRPYQRELAVSYGAVEITSRELVIRGKEIAARCGRRRQY